MEKKNGFRSLLNRFYVWLEKVVNPLPEEIEENQAEAIVDMLLRRFSIEDQSKIVLEVHRLLSEKRKQQIQETDEKLTILKKDFEKLDPLQQHPAA